jgi:hypothetical protein
MWIEGELDGGRARGRRGCKGLIGKPGEGGEGGLLAPVACGMKEAESEHPLLLPRSLAVALAPSVPFTHVKHSTSADGPGRVGRGGRGSGCKALQAMAVVPTRCGASCPAGPRGLLLCCRPPPPPVETCAPCAPTDTRTHAWRDSRWTCRHGSAHGQWNRTGHGRSARPSAVPLWVLSLCGNGSGNA